MLCRALKCSVPKHASSIEIKASFEKAYWKLKPHLPEDLCVLAASTLCSVALNYVHRKGPKRPRTLLTTIHQLKKRDNIVITKHDKGSGVVIMDKTQYIRLLAEASINDATKFRLVVPERPTSSGRLLKHYHPLLQEEKELESIVHLTVPTSVTHSVHPSGS